MITFPVTVNEVVEPAAAIPETVELPVVVAFTFAVIEPAVALPIVFPEIAVDADAPVVLIPTNPQTTAGALPAVEIELTMLLLTFKVPVEFACIPNEFALVVVVIEIDPVPELAPTVLGVMFPIDTEPPKTEIPEKTPGAVVDPLVVDNDNPEIVFP